MLQILDFFFGGGLALKAEEMDAPFKSPWPYQPEWLPPEWLTSPFVLE